MSLNHNDIEKTNITKAKKNTLYASLKLCIDNAPLLVKVNKPKLVYRGHGEGDTKWKGWFWTLVLTNSVIYLYLLIS